MEVVLISEDLFKLYGPIKEDTVATKFVPYLLLAQKMYIDRILGARLSAELQDQIRQAGQTPDADPYPITPANQALLVQIAPVLSHYAVYQGLPFHWAALVNKGVTLRNSENSDAIDIDDLAQLRRWLKDDAEEWGRQLLEYLCRCRASYPLWAAAGRCGDDCGGAAPDPLDAGIWIPRNKKRCC